MANDLKMVFIDYASKLQAYLDELAPNVFIVEKEKDINVQIEDKVHVIVSYLQGTSNKDSVSLPIMLKIYSSQELAENVIGVFIALSKMKAQSSYNELVEVEPDVVEEATIFEQINTPAVMNYDGMFGTNNHWVEYVGFCQILVLFGVGNIKKITIDSEEIEFLNGSINFATEPFSNRVSGGSLNLQKIKAGTTNIQFQMVNKTGVFANKVLDIMFGSLDKNTILNVNVELTNGYKKENLKMLISQSNLAVSKQTPTLPSMNITLMLADTRTM